MRTLHHRHKLSRMLTIIPSACYSLLRMFIPRKGRTSVHRNFADADASSSAEPAPTSNATTLPATREELHPDNRKCSSVKLCLHSRSSFHVDALPANQGRADSLAKCNHSHLSPLSMFSMPCFPPCTNFCAISREKKNEKLLKTGEVECL